ncbi:Pycsar system effector family protein [Mucilaginibacter lutimaris]|uniref:Pycsar system effector family protein n=1 Tax=Mucilaginibacter lutimaris TaxID=931629 RepID=A0ABW2ZI24_9SPHI
MDNFNSRSELIFSRFDKYLETVNTKGTLYLAINTFFISAVIANIDKLNTSFVLTEEVITFIGLFLCVCLISTALVLLAINPFLNTGTKNGVASSIFFYGSVAAYEKDVFIKRLNDISTEELKDDVGGQLYCLAEGLKSKYNKLKWAGWLVLGEFILLIPLTVLLTSHLKK